MRWSLGKDIRRGLTPEKNPAPHVECGQLQTSRTIYPICIHRIPYLYIYQWVPPEIRTLSFLPLLTSSLGVPTHTSHLPSASNCRRRPRLSRQARPCVHIPTPGSMLPPVALELRSMISAEALVGSPVVGMSLPTPAPPWPAATVTLNPMRARHTAVARPRHTGREGKARYFEARLFSIYAVSCVSTTLSRETVSPYEPQTAVPLTPVVIFLSRKSKHHHTLTEDTTPPADVSRAT